MSSGNPVFATPHNTPESHKNLKHDRDLPVSPCSRFVTSYHLTSHRHGTLRSTRTQRNVTRSGGHFLSRRLPSMTICASPMHRSFPFSPRSNRALEAGDFWAVSLDDGRFGCGRVLQTEGEELPTKTQVFFGGLHDWVGDAPPTEQDVASVALVAFGTMHVKAIRENGGRNPRECATDREPK